MSTIYSPIFRPSGVLSEMLQHPTAHHWPKVQILRWTGDCPWGVGGTGRSLNCITCKLWENCLY